MLFVLCSEITLTALANGIATGLAANFIIQGVYFCIFSYLVINKILFVRKMGLGK